MTLFTLCILLVLLAFAVQEFTLSPTESFRRIESPSVGKKRRRRLKAVSRSSVPAYTPVPAGNQLAVNYRHRGSPFSLTRELEAPARA